MGLRVKIDNGNPAGSLQQKGSEMSIALTLLGESDVAFGHNDQANPENVPLDIGVSDRPEDCVVTIPAVSTLLLNGKKCEVIFDTGSGMSIVNLDWIRKNQLQDSIESTQLSMTSVNGQMIKSYG